MNTLFLSPPDWRPLDDLDVRDETDEAGEEIPGGRIEFAMFSEGEFIESIFVTEARAREVYRALGELLGEPTT